MTSPTRELRFVTGGGRLIAVATAAAADTGLITGALYRLTMMGAAGANSIACCNWRAADPTVADGGFDFAIVTGESLYMRAPGPELRAIRGVAVDATLLIQRINEGA